MTKQSTTPLLQGADGWQLIQGLQLYYLSYPNTPALAVYCVVDTHGFHVHSNVFDVAMFLGVFIILPVIVAMQMYMYVDCRDVKPISQYRILKLHQQFHTVMHYQVSILHSQYSYVNTLRQIYLVWLFSLDQAHQKFSIRLLLQIYIRSRPQHQHSLADF